MASMKDVGLDVQEESLTRQWAIRVAGVGSFRTCQVVRLVHGLPLLWARPQRSA